MVSVFNGNTRKGKRVRGVQSSSKARAIKGEKKVLFGLRRCVHDRKDEEKKPDV
jgi:hypothetical protein